MRHLAIPALLWAALVARPASAADLPGLLQRLADPATHEAASAEFLAIPASDLPALHDALDPPQTPPAIRAVAAVLLPTLYQRRISERLDSVRQRTAKSTDARYAEYLRVGQHDPRWDTIVQKAYTSLLRPDADSALLFKQAIDAGCTDAVVQYYYYTRALTAKKAEPSVALPALDKLGAEVESSGYSDERKFFLNLRCASLASQADPQVLSPNAPLTRALSYFPGFLAADPGDDALYDTLDLLNPTLLATGRSRKAAFDALYPHLAKAVPDAAPTLAFAADFYIDYAWEARGNGYAQTVTPQGWRLFEQRIDQAAQLATRAWRADPLASHNAALMITICMAQSADRPVMETWWKRAMLANPGNFDACERKATYLLPRWHGSQAEGLEFGRECVALGDADNRLPIILLQVHDDIVEHDPAYQLTPAAWKEIQLVYAKLLGGKTLLNSNRRTLLWDRATYLKHACDAQQWSAVLSLMNEFGDDIDMNQFGGKPLYDTFRRRALRETSH